MREQTDYLIFAGIIVFTSALLGFSPHLEVPGSANHPGIDGSKPAATVGMTNTMKFTPDTVRIETGETVRWENSSLLVHSVTGDPSQTTIDGSAELPEEPASFNSGMMDPKDTFTHTFEVSGSYQYFCIPHEATKMYGWVIVEE